MNRRQPPKQQLEDILQDPNASWQQIRQAMKSSGGAGCTNAAVMRALSTRGIICDDKDTKKGINDKLIATTKNKDEVAANAKDGVANNDKVIPGLANHAASARPPIRRGSSTISENNISENSISEKKRSSTPGTPGSDINNDEKQQDVTNSQNRRTSRRSGMMRRRGSGMRGSRTGSFRLSRQSSSKRSLIRQSSLKRSDSSKKSDSGGGEWSPAQMSIKSSVNIMDFGFDQKILLDNMDTLSETHSLGEDEMGKQVRRSSVLSQESNSSFSGSGYLGWANGSDSDVSAELFSSGVLHSSLSHLVDSSGFLDWDPSKLNLSPSESISKDEIKQRCDPISAPPLIPTDKEDSTKKEARAKGRLASDMSRHIGFAAMSGEDYLTTMLEDSTRSSADDVEKEEDREWCIEDYENPQDNAVKSKPLRDTLFGGRLKRLSSVSSNINGEKKDEEIQMNDIKDALIKQVARDQPNTNCKPSKPSRRRRSTIDNITGALPSFLGGLGETKAADNTTTEQNPSTQLGEVDNRGAIWIKGGQDIRKLYEEQKDIQEEPKKGGVGRFLRRITIEDDNEEGQKKRGFLRRATISD